MAGAPRLRAQAGFCRYLELDAADANRCPDAFDRLRTGALQAVVVHGVYGSDVLAPVVERLERHDPPFLTTWFPTPFRSWFYGRNVNLAHPALAGYFDEAAEFAAHLDALFPPGHRLPQRVGGILAQLDHGRPFVAAPGPEAGQRYMFTTIRGHLEHGYLPPHFDNEQALQPSYRHLHTLVGLHMTSFVLTLAAPEGGGELQLFDYVCQPDAAVLINQDGVAKPDVRGMVPASFAVPAGSLIVVDSGRYLHSVAPVRGSRTRWTACSFMALARDEHATYCWG